MKRIFAIGDIHGCAHTLENLLHKEMRLSKKDHLFFLGDYIDRGKNSKQVLDIIIGLQNKKYNINTLMGNHEKTFINTCSDDGVWEQWLQNFGGLATVKSFNIVSFDELENKYKKFFSTLELYALVENHILVHAGLNFSKEDIFEDTYAMLWTRNMEIDYQKLGNKKIVHGHTPQALAVTTGQMNEMNNADCGQVLNIDNGCVYKTFEGMGQLTAYELNSKTLFSVKNID